MEKLALGSVWISLIAKNSKHYSKIIFKCVNSTVRPNFKEKFAEIRICRSCEQYRGPTQKSADVHVCCFSAIQTYAKY